MMSDLTVVLAAVGLVVAALLAAGLGLLFRNRDGARPSSAAGLPALSSKAAVLLVDLDRALGNAENELGFAIAQFGEGKTADFAAAVTTARTTATAAFRLRRELDDAFPEPVTKQRELTLQIIALCEKATKTLQSQDASFSSLRAQELDAPSSLSTLRGRIEAASARLSPAKKTLARLARDFRRSIAAEHEKAIAEAGERLAETVSIVEAAEKQLSPSGVNAVVDELRAAEQSVNAAVTVLDSIDSLAERFDEAASTVAKLATAQKADLAEARREREAAPDAETGASIIDAIDSVEKVLARVAAAAKPADPIEQLDELNAAIAELDSALASARNQTQRLAHARAALPGTLVSATSQIAAVRGFITAGGGQVGAEARTRLSEAERELRDAEAEADPVAALDAARRAVTDARDADALARYDAMT